MLFDHFIFSTLSSGLNSLAAVTWEDFLKQINFFRDLKPSKQAAIIRGLGEFPTMHPNTAI